MPDEQSPEQRHRERLDRPVDEQSDADPLPVLAHAAQGRAVDLEQHRYEHQPDQRSDALVDVTELPIRDSDENSTRTVAEEDPGTGTQGNHERHKTQDTFEYANG